jgi:hypothetical protein
MNVEDIVLVVHREGKEPGYLDGNNNFGPFEESWPYSTTVAFDHAEEFGGNVIMVLPSGRQIPVTRADFVFSDGFHWLKEPKERR